MPIPDFISRGEADALFASLRYHPLDEGGGFVLYAHEDEPADLLQMDFGSGDIAREPFIFVLEHHGINLDAVHAYFEAATG